MRPLEQGADLTAALVNLATCLHHQPGPAWAEATAAYREAADLLSAPDQQAFRGWLLCQLADCLRSQLEPDWKGAIACYTEALELLPAEQPTERGVALRQLAYCLRKQSVPDRKAALACCQQALTLFSAPEQQVERATVEWELQFCLDNETAAEKPVLEQEPILL